MYDIIIRNGRVIDHASNTDAIKDIFIKDGYIVDKNVNEKEVKAEKIIDATGCIVTPGFLDSHTHLFWGGSGDLSTHADISCLPNCVTTGIDAGSTGVSSFESFYRSNIVNSETTIKVLLHPCITGVQVPPSEEEENPAWFKTERMRQLFDKYPDVLRGLKIRMSKGTAGVYGMEPIYKTQEIAQLIREDGHHCMLGIHFSDLADGVEMKEFVDSIRTGDILYHFYHPSGNSIFNSDGSIMDCVLEARERGVLFDSARGRINFSIENILKASKLGFYPDIISTDLGRRTLYRKPNFSIINSMSLFLNVGMPIEDIIKSVTYTPSKAFGIENEVGAIKVNGIADVAIIKIINMRKTYGDTFGGSFEGEELIIPMATIKAGRTVFQQISMDNEIC
ncbi:MAG: amidohydrolase family protein [Clostridia bacterium]|nr:amidohydrolase family protein [Clostridia bacterium]